MEQRKDKRDKNYIFKPDYTPIFLGLFAQDQQKSKENIIPLVNEALQCFEEKFTNDQVIKKNKEQLLSVFKYPESHHITSFFAGGKSSNSQFYLQFQEGIESPIELSCLAYIPNKIICSPCFPDPDAILIENKCPHMTMLVGEWKPVKSNAVLEALFIKPNAPLQKEYQSGKISDKQTKFIEKYENIEVEGEGAQTIYIYKGINVLTIPGITKAHYGQKKGGKDKKGNK